MGKMNEVDYLLIVLIEEASEVQFNACKALRFGIDNVYKDYSSNIEALNHELSDLLTIIEMLKEHGANLNPVVSQAKRAKVKKYMQSSIELGKLENAAKT